MVSCYIQQLSEASDLPLPSYATEQSAGMDLYALLEKPHIMHPMERFCVRTGIMMALPDGYEAQIRPRSGLAARFGIGVLNSPGTIDADYRGEIQVILIHLGAEPFEITRGMRIAQMIIAPIARITWHRVDALPATERGHGGFGSTGTGAIQTSIASATLSAQPKATKAHHTQEECVS